MGLLILEKGILILEKGILILEKGIFNPRKAKIIIEHGNLS